MILIHDLKKGILFKLPISTRMLTIVLNTHQSKVFFLTLCGNPSMYIYIYLSKILSFKVKIDDLAKYKLTSLVRGNQNVRKRLNKFRTVVAEVPSIVVNSKCSRDGDEHFSEESMRQRQPLLYHQLIRQHQTAEERAEADRPDMSNCSLANIIMEHIGENIIIKT